MTAAALISLAALSLLLGGGLVWAIREARAESRLAIAAAKDALTSHGAAAAAERLRDAANARAAKAEDEATEARAKHAQMHRLYSLSLEMLHDQERAKLVGASDADVVRLAGELLQNRAAAATARADAPGDDRGAPGPAAVQSGAGAVGGPARVDRGD